jgi:hypothetical protein
MNSPFANIYESILAQISTLLNDDSQPVFPYIDMDYGQLETKERPQVDFPCILIDFPSWRFTDLGNLVQSGTGNICLKIATDPYDATSNITPDQYRLAAQQILDLEWSVYKLFQGWAPAVVLDGSGTTTQPAKPMIRSNIDTDNRRPGIKVRELMFSSGFTDYSAKRTTTMAPATPIITDQIDLTLPLPVPHN